MAEKRRHTPLWLDVKADHLDSLATRVIVPLRKATTKEALKQRLDPEFQIEGQQVYADTANLGTFPLGLLRWPVASLRGERLAIEDAPDFLFTGFCCP